MARKSRNVCLIPPWWTQEEIQSRTCGDGSHPHIPRAEAATLIDWKEAEWVDGLADRVLRIKRVAKALRDKSSKLGWYLAKCVRQKKAWALAMEAQMAARLESPTEREPTKPGPYDDYAWVGW